MHVGSRTLLTPFGARQSATERRGTADVAAAFTRCSPIHPMCGCRAARGLAIGFALSLLFAGLSFAQKPTDNTLTDAASLGAIPVNRDADQTEHNSDALTLKQCIDIALRTNPGLAQQKRETDVAQAEKAMTQGRLWPELRAVGGYSHFLEDRLISPRRPGTLDVLEFTDDLATGRLALNMPLYMGGRLHNQVEAAKFLVQAAEHRSRYTAEELVFNVSSVFYAILEQQHVIDSLLFSRSTLEQHAKKTVELFEASKAARVDLLRTEVRLADIEQQLLREKNTLAVQHLVLAGLLGVDHEGEVPRIKGELVLADMPADLTNGVATARNLRHDYQALKAGIEAQRENLRAAEAARLPRVSLQASYGNQWALDRSDANEVGEIGVFVEIPLFEGGRIGAAIRREQAKLNAMRESLRKLDLRVQLEVGTAASDIRSTRARIDVTQKAVEQASESLRIERESYDLGKGAIVDVLDAQSALLTSQTNYHRSLADYNTALAQFRLATGASLHSADQ